MRYHKFNKCCLNRNKFSIFLSGWWTFSYRIQRRKLTYGVPLSKYPGFRLARVLNCNISKKHLSFFDSDISKMRDFENFTIVTRELKKGRFPAYLYKHLLLVQNLRTHSKLNKNQWPECRLTFRHPDGLHGAWLLIWLKIKLTFCFLCCVKAGPWL